MNSARVQIHLPETESPEDVETECSLCDSAITDQYIIGVLKMSSNWTTMCVGCHKKHGIKLGEGRGYLYQLVNGLFRKQSYE